MKCHLLKGMSFLISQKSLNSLVLITIDIEYPLEDNLFD